MAKVSKRWVVCNINGSTNQRRFRIHLDFGTAVAEANRLACEHAGQHFMVMETVGGFVRLGSKTVPVDIEEEERG